MKLIPIKIIPRNGELKAINNFIDIIEKMGLYCGGAGCKLFIHGPLSKTTMTKLKNDLNKSRAIAGYTIYPEINDTDEELDQLLW